MDAGSANAFFFLYVGAFFGSCMGLFLLLYNVVGLVGFLREDNVEPASALAKAAWAVGLLSGLLGPCAWVGAVLALILARVERGRIYAETSSLSGATPCRMATVNGGLILAMWAVLSLLSLASWLST